MGKEEQSISKANMVVLSDPDPAPAPNPSWFTPKRLVVIFCLINFLNFVDRAAIGSNGVNGSPRICTKSGQRTSGSGIHVNPVRLIGVGLTVWTLANAGCGFSFNFWSITICRMLVGVSDGEASFVGLGAPYIDDIAPVAKKAAWLGIFYMCVPTGVAIGYVYGGVVGDHFSWSYAFFEEAILMFPFAVLGFLMKPLQLKGCSLAESKKPLTGVKTSASEAKGNITYAFVLGAYSYWGPKAGYSIYRMKNADMIFGGVTLVCGTLGTLAGGFILDKTNSTISNAFKLLSVAVFMRATLCFGNFCFRNLYAFLALFTLGELFLSATTDHLHNWRKTAMILTAILFLAAILRFIGIFLHSADKSKKRL